MSDKYGIQYLLEAVAFIKKKGKIPIKLRIAGKGPQEEEYKRLAKKLKIDDITTWLGFISQEDAAKEWANMDVAVIPSTLESESFGVSAVEAQACEIPLIISDIPGLMEATDPGCTSVVVKRKNAQAIAGAVEICRKCFWENKQGRAFVKKYDVQMCFIEVEQLFNERVKAKVF